MKKIATITFHWAKNYGAVMQSFALQKYLIKKGYDSEIIDYIPLRISLIEFYLALKKWNINFFKKANRFKSFKKERLKKSKKTYFNNKSLLKCKNDYDAVICGSDQIWNQAFTMRAEAKVTLSYFLNFLGEKTKRISYAASFGSTEIPKEMSKIILPELEKFSAVSVREKGAVDILKEIGIVSQRTVDPTLLLDQEDYLQLLENKSFDYDCGITSYIINKGALAQQVNDYVIKKYSSDFGKNNVIENCDVYEWIYRIKNSSFVVTNSFHGVVFSLIFNKPFLAVAIPRSGMNDRIETLLSTVDLLDRFIYEFDDIKIDSVIKTEIDWNVVNQKIKESRKISENFLAEALKQ